MFNAAYLRLTAWYVAIIMAISILFSAWIYNEATHELRSGLQRQGVVMEEPIFGADKLQIIQTLADEQLEVSRARLLTNLVYLNILVLGVGAIASYLLAKRTMRPIEAALEAQNRFTADASHELRTPLTAMKTEIEVALRDASLSKQEARELLESNLEEIDRLSSLSEALLTLARDDEPPALKPVALDQLAGLSCKRLNSLAAAKQITVTCNLEPVTVVGDKISLEKIVGILLDNAIKYSPAKTTIAVSSSKKGTAGFLTIADQGLGIKASDQAHIFERFYRADTSRSKEKIAGHGLGLSIAKKLIESMHGEIQVTSQAGKGSTFTVKLPAV